MIIEVVKENGKKVKLVKFDGSIESIVDIANILGSDQEIETDTEKNRTNFCGKRLEVGDYIVRTSKKAKKMTAAEIAMKYGYKEN